MSSDQCVCVGQLWGAQVPQHGDFTGVLQLLGVSFSHKRNTSWEGSFNLSNLSS